MLEADIYSIFLLISFLVGDLEKIKRIQPIISSSHHDDLDSHDSFLPCVILSLIKQFPISFPSIIDNHISPHLQSGEFHSALQRTRGLFRNHPRWLLMKLKGANCMRKNEDYSSAMSSYFTLIFNYVCLGTFFHKLIVYINTTIFQHVPPTLVRYYVKGLVFLCSPIYLLIPSSILSIFSGLIPEPFVPAVTVLIHLLL